MNDLFFYQDKISSLFYLASMNHIISEMLNSNNFRKRDIITLPMFQMHYAKADLEYLILLRDKFIFSIILQFVSQNNIFSVSLENFAE